jgi:hypothetical protein
LLQAICATVEVPNRLCIAIGWHGYIVCILAHINASGIRVDYLQCSAVLFGRTESVVPTHAVLSGSVGRHEPEWLVHKVSFSFAS